ncbi:winged helix-turn-helix transcriptional regulator [Kitasatospora sp. NPDC096204]|uniref:winged helix-turn-helix transcriptional regulator n=1 Tax=Kitasatospora sp. NPDC096204 TaxID=3364094 RepID=UPI00381FC8F1
MRRAGARTIVALRSSCVDRSSTVQCFADDGPAPPAERDGFVIRTVHVGPAQHVQYELTPLGRSLLDLLEAARAWAEAHLHEVIEAREAASPAGRTS